MTRSHVLSAALGALVLFGCSDGGGADPADAAAADAAADASNLCPPGSQLFTGEYVDWDSTPDDFLGIFDATIAEVDDPGNSTTTAPNGRGILCIDPDSDTDLDFTQENYLPLLFSASIDAVAIGTYFAAGLTPARADTLFSDELSLSRDPAMAQVIVDVRIYPGGEPAIGATVAIGDASAGAFSRDSARLYVPGSTLTDGGSVLFANVAPGTTTVTVTAPPGATCVGRSSMTLRAGSLNFTEYACN